MSRKRAPGNNQRSARETQSKIMSQAARRAFIGCLVRIKHLGRVELYNKAGPNQVLPVPRIEYLASVAPTGIELLGERLKEGDPGVWKPHATAAGPGRGRWGRVPGLLLSNCRVDRPGKQPRP